MIHRQGGCPPVNFHRSFQHIRPVPVNHVAEPLIGLGKKCGFHNTGLVFERQKLHGIPVLGLNPFPCHEPAGKPNPLADEMTQLNRLNRTKSPKLFPVKCHGVAITQKTENHKFSSQAFQLVCVRKVGRRQISLCVVEQAPASRYHGSVFLPLRQLPHEPCPVSGLAKNIQSATVDQCPCFRIIRPNPLQHILKTLKNCLSSLGHDQFPSFFRKPFDGKQPHTHR